MIERQRTGKGKPGTAGCLYSVTLAQRWAFSSNRGREPAGSSNTGTRRFRADERRKEHNPRSTAARSTCEAEMARALKPSPRPAG